MKKWSISKNQKKLLDSLTKDIKIDTLKKVLDIGAGRTSVSYLANKFKKTTVETIVYPGDKRKIQPILECVKEKNYKIIESDIKDIKNRKADLVLAHLFLGEAEKFGGNKFEDILNSLFSIKTKYLVIINREDDKINYFLLMKKIYELGEILKISYQKTDDDHECIGFTIKFK